MSESSDQPEQTSRKITRRDFLIKVKDKGLQVAAAYITAKALGASAIQSPEQPVLFRNPIKHMVNDVPIWFGEYVKKPIGRYTSAFGEYFNLETRQHIPSQECKDRMLLLGDSPAFEEGRDTHITPEFANSTTINNILAKGDENINLWVQALSKSQKDISNSSQYEKHNTQFTKLTNHESSFTPNQLLKLRQYTNAISDVLNYDQFSPAEFSELSLSERLQAGYTNCQEFTLTTAVILASEQLKMPSEILRFSYKLSPEKIEQLIKLDEKRKGRPLTEAELEVINDPYRDHVCNIINFNNTPVVIDTTTFGGNAMTLKNYFRSFTQDGIELSSTVRSTSILSQDSYKPFPWHDPEWINAETSLGIAAASKSAT